MPRILVILCVVGFVMGARGSAPQGPVARTPLGALRGHWMETRGGRRVAAFTAVPYAQPPLGDLRFKAPVPVQPWEAERDATAASPACVQRNPYTRERALRGHEDCLYLNVYTPSPSPSVTEAAGGGRLLPVMVWLHGGGWMCGDSSTASYGPEFLLDRDVLLVTVNYRLGPLGFLSTQDAVCPGNNGLKDQQEALRFVQRTACAFGGDPAAVTLFGESAGGASVHLHMLSDTSAGLFHRAISQSGTGLAPWAEAAPGEPLARAWRLARALHCPPAPSDRLLACLRTKDSYDIIDTEFQFYEWDYEAMTPFKAVVEPALPGAFLTAAPRAPRASPAAARVPWLTGINKDEGCLKSVWITSNSTLLEQFVSGWERVLPLTLYYEGSPLAARISRRVRRRYLQHDPEDGILQMYSDAYFKYPLVEAARHEVRAGRRVFLYELRHRAANSFSQIFGDPLGDYGVCHADELQHLFPIHFLREPPAPADRNISEMMVTMWTNFATSGDPNQPSPVGVRWPAADGALRHLCIQPQPEVHSQLAHSSRFWGTLPLWPALHALLPDADHTPDAADSNTRDEL